MSKAKTLMGVDFKYSGSMDAALIVHKKIDIHIAANTINLIKSE